MCDEIVESDYSKRLTSISYAVQHCATHQADNLIATAQDIYDFMNSQPVKPVVHRRRKRHYAKRVKVVE